MRKSIGGILLSIFLAGPAFAQSQLPSMAAGTVLGRMPGVGTGTPSAIPFSNLALQLTGSLNGTSVRNPGTNTLEMVLPPITPTITANAIILTGTSLFTEQRLSNSGTNYTVTLPASTTIGLINGTRLHINNIDSTATATLNAGSGTQINGGSSVSLGPARASWWIYDTTGTTPTWRSTMNSLTMLLSGNNLSDIASASAARTNLAVPGLTTNNILSGSLSLTALGSVTCANSVVINASNLLGTGSCPGSASSVQPGVTTVTSGNNGYALTNSGGILANNQLFSAAGGLINVLRNASLTAWFHGTSGTATTTAATTNWTAEGIFAIPTGASITWSQQSTSNCPTGNPTFNCVKLTGNTSVTDVKVRFVLESYTAAKLAGQTVTFQFLWKNNSGSSVTPTLATNFPTTQDGSVTSGAAWSAQTNDLAATNLQACTNGSTCTESYTLSVSSSATAGYEFVVDFGNNFSSNSNTLTLGGGFDARVTPGVSTGTNANPPAPEIRDAESDIRWNQRFYQASYDNGTASGASTALGIVMVGLQNAGTFGYMLPFNYPTPMRGAATIATWDAAGNSGKISGQETGGSATLTNNVSNTGGSPTNISTRGFLFPVAGGSTTATWLSHYTADASIWGG